MAGILPAFFVCGLLLLFGGWFVVVVWLWMVCAVVGGSCCGCVFSVFYLRVGVLGCRGD